MNIKSFRNVLTTTALAAALMIPANSIAFADETLTTPDSSIEKLELTTQADVLVPEEIIGLEVNEIPTYASSELGTFSDLELALDAAMSITENHGTTFSFTYTGDMDTLKKDFSNAMNLVMLKPGNDYFHGTIKTWSYSYTSNGKISVNLTYRATLEQEQFVTKRVKEIADDLRKPGMSDLDKVFAVNEYVVTNTVYSKTAETTPHHVYALVAEGKAVCQAYALLTYRLLTELGVEARYVVGFAGEAHAWNSVKVDDNWYHLDTTWNDPSFNGEDTLSNVSYKYFLVTSDMLRKDHSWDEVTFPVATDDRFSHIQRMAYGHKYNDVIYYSDASNNNGLSKFSLVDKSHEILLNSRAYYIEAYNEFVYFSNYSNGAYLTSYNLITKQLEVIDPVAVKQLKIIDGTLHYKVGSNSKQYKIPLSQLEQEVQNVELKIIALSEFSSQSALTEAREAFNALTEEQQGQIKNLAKLTELELAYPINIAAADIVADEVAKYSVTSSRADLLSVIAQFEALTSAQQAHVSNKELVNSFKATINAQNAEIDAVEKTIKSLKATSKTYLADITKAREAVKALSDELQTEVENIGTLVEIEANTAAAKNAFDLIAQLNGQSVDAIITAREAYTTLSTAMKKHVTNLKTLTTFEAQVKSVTAAVKAINAIKPESTKFVTQVKAARKAFDKAGSQQNLITNVEQFLDTEKQAAVFEQISKLKATNAKYIEQVTKAKTDYDALTNKNLVSNVDKLNKALEAIKPAQSMVNRITSLDSASIVTIMDTRSDYNKLTKAERKHISNLKELTSLEKNFKNEIAAYKAINAINPASNKFVAQVKSARKAFDKVSEDKKALVTNAAVFADIEKQATVFEQISKLKASSAKYIEQVTKLKADYDALSNKDLVTNSEKLNAAFEAIKPAQTVVAQISSLDSASVAPIVAARTAYNGLPKADKKYVTNVKQLATLEKTVKNATNAIKAIDAINPTSAKFVAQVKAARKAFDQAGTQQSLVTNSEVFLDTEKQAIVFEQISKLKASNANYIEQVLAAKEAYDALEKNDLISNVSKLNTALDAIKPSQAVVEQITSLDTASIAPIVTARTAYNTLTKSQKKYVTNAATLATLEKQVAAPVKTMKLIDETKALDVSTAAYLKKASAMKNAYTALSDAHKALITTKEDYEFHAALYDIKTAQKSRNWQSVTVDTFTAIGVTAVTVESFEAITAAFNALKAGTGTATVQEITTNVAKFIQ